MKDNFCEEHNFFYFYYYYDYCCWFILECFFIKKYDALLSNSRTLSSFEVMKLDFYFLYILEI